jgi:antitoxin ParD1/3/4
VNVSLTPELEELVHRKMETGCCDSASDVIADALHLMAERDRMQALNKDEIRRQIAAGMTSLRAGNSCDGEIFLAAMDAELAELER